MDDADARAVANARLKEQALLGKQRVKAYTEGVYSEGRLGPLRTVFDGWGLALVEGERTPETTVAIQNPDYELVADAMERGLPRCSFNSQYGDVTPRSDGDLRLTNYDWNTETSGELTVPRAQVQPLIELLRSLPGLPWIGFGTGHDEHRRAYDLVVLHRGMPDRLGQPWGNDEPLIELFSWLPSVNDRGREKHFLTTLDLTALLSRSEGESLHISTMDGQVTIDGETMDKVIPRLRSALKPAPS